MTQMEKKLELAKDRLAFLVEQTQFSPADMSLNTQTFTWHGRMDDIFEEHKVIAQEKKAQYEEALKVCSKSQILVTEHEQTIHVLMICVFLICIFQNFF